MSTPYCAHRTHRIHRTHPFTVTYRYLGGRFIRIKRTEDTKYIPMTWARRSTTLCDDPVLDHWLNICGWQAMRRKGMGAEWAKEKRKEDGEYTVRKYCEIVGELPTYTLSVSPVAY